MSLTAVSFTTTFDYTNNVFILTDTTDYAGQSVNTLVSNIPDVIGNFKIIDPNGNVIWNNTDYSIETGTAQGGGNTSITLQAGSGSSATNDYYNGLYCFLSAGTGSPQSKRVATAVGSYNGTTKIATTAAWTGTNPAAATTYRFTFGDIVPAGAVTTQTSIGLSLSQEEVPVAGVYTIIYTVKWDISGTGQYTTSTTSFDFDFVPPVIELSSTVDCLIPQLIATDATNYVVDGITPTITRTHTLYNPPSIGGSTVGTATDLSISNFYTPAEYQHTLSVDLSYTLTDGTIVTMTLTGNQTINVTCDHKLCDIYCCVRTLWNNYMGYLNSNPTLANQYLTKLTQVTSIMTLISQAYECSGSGSAIDEYVNQILTIANCEAGCGCTSSTPVPVTGLGGNGTTIVVSAGNGITVTSATVGGTTTYTVNINQSILNSINSIQAVTVVGATNITVVESSTGTWTVTGATVTVDTDTYLPGANSITITPTGTPVTDYKLKYVARKAGLIYSNQTPVPSISGALQDLMSYTMPANTLAVNGDELIIRAYFINADTGTAASPLLNYVDFGSIQLPLSNYLPSIRKIQFEVRVERLSATTVKYQGDLYAMGFLGNVAWGYMTDFSSPVVVPDLTANTVIIKTECNGLVAADITCDYLTIELNPKI